MADEKRPGSLATRLPLVAIVAVFVLTFAVWIFFDWMEMPLQKPATTVVGILMLGIVMAVRWGWSHRRTKGNKS
jgi:hypothetical protein